MNLLYSKYIIVIHNDDSTYMEFVVQIIEYFFGYSYRESIDLMMIIHKKGKTSFGMFNKEEAESIANKIIYFARKYSFPLMCSVFKNDNQSEINLIQTNRYSFTYLNLFQYRSNLSAQNENTLKKTMNYIRARPGHHIGGTDIKAFHNLAAEIINNSFYEVNFEVASFIQINFVKDGSITIKDNGRGIPVDPPPRYPDKSAVEILFTNLVSATCLTLCVVNAFSSWLEVIINKDGYTWKQMFINGIPELPLQQLGKSKQHGTEISFLPNENLFTNSSWRMENILDICRFEIDQIREYLPNDLLVRVSNQDTQEVHELRVKGK